MWHSSVIIVIFPIYKWTFYLFSILIVYIKQLRLTANMAKLQSHFTKQTLTWRATFNDKITWIFLFWMDNLNANEYVEEDIFLFVSILLGSVSPLCLASPAASALFRPVLSSAGLPIPPLSSAVNTKRHKASQYYILFKILSQSQLVSIDNVRL